MLNQTTNPTSENGWIPLFAPSDVHLFAKREDRREAFPGDVPAMPATVLGLELLLQESYIDLRLASELVLSDLGATIQLLRLTGGEFEDAEDRPSRMEDCIASLDVEDWFAAVSAVAMTRDSEDAPAIALWEHSYLIAQYSRLVAESLDGVFPEEAYMVGLLHEIAAIPGSMGSQTIKNSPTGSMTASSLTRKLAHEWCLPAYLIEALCSLRESRATSIWTRILSSAHELAEAEGDGVGLLS